MKNICFTLLLVANLITVKTQVAQLTEEKWDSLITGCVEFTIDEPKREGPVLNAGDFGLSESNSPEENVIALQRALAHAKEKGAYKLIIPHGVYRMRWFNDEPVEEQLAYSWAAGPNPPVTRIIELDGMRDFILEGSHSEFIILDTDQPSMGAMLFVANSERVIVRNMTFDWDWASRPIAALAYIERIHVEEGYIDWYVPHMRLPPDTTLNRESGTTGKPWNPVTNMRPPEKRMWVLEDDSPGFGGLSMWQLGEDKVLGPNHIRVWITHQPSLERARVGQCAHMTFHTNFDPYGVEANNNDHLAFRNVNLYTALNHRGYTADYNRYLEISNAHIIPRPGTGRVKSAHGTFEIHNSRGYFLCEDNVVDSAMDDFMHLSDGFVAGGIEVEDEKTVLCKRIQFYSARYTLRPGVTIVFKDAAMNPLGFERVIRSVEWLEDFYPVQDKQHAARVIFEEALPEELPRETVLWNKALGTGKYIIRRNFGHTMACRAILTTWPNGIIEDNTFHNAGYSGLLMGVSAFGDRWFTGPGPSNLIIRRNVFNHVNRVKRNSADIGVMPLEDAQILFEGIIIEDNVIKNSISDQVLDLKHIRGLIVRGNRFVNPAENINTLDAAIKIDRCEEVFVHSNHIEALAD